jgi:hypothetical protein
VEERKAANAHRNFSSQINSQESFWQQTRRDPVALYTFWLAIFTFGLTVSTVLLWYQTKRLAEGAEGQSDELRKSVAAAQRSAEAASLSAQAAVAAETARVRVTEIKLDVFGGTFASLAESHPVAPDAKEKLTRGFATFTLRNTGRTDAEVTGISINYAVDVELPALPSYGKARPLHPSRNLPAANGEMQWWDYMRPRPTDAEIASVEADAKYWAYGYVLIIDFLNNRQRVKFSYRLSSGGLLSGIGDFFYPDGPPAYFGQEPEA